MNARPSAGFTLIELLVVMAVLGTVVAMAGLSFTRDPRHHAVQEAQLFVQLVQHARQRSLLEGQPLAVRIGRHDYQLARFAGQRWVAVAEVRDTGLQLQLELDGAMVAEDDSPGLLLYPHDEHSVFSLHFSHGAERLATVSSDGLNDPWLER